jgi:hypothetical protein
MLLAEELPKGAKDNFGPVETRKYHALPEDRINNAYSEMHGAGSPTLTLVIPVRPYLDTTGLEQYGRKKSYQKQFVH